MRIKFDVLVSIYIFLFIIGSALHNIGFETFNQIILWGITPVILFILIMKYISEVPLKLPTEFWLYFSLIFISVLALPIVEDFDRFFRYFRLLISLSAISFIIIFTIFISKNNNLLIYSIWLSGFFITFITILNPIYVKGNIFGRLEGIMGDANATANVMLNTIIFSIFLFNQINKKYLKYIPILIIPFNLYVLVETASRGNFIILIILVLYLLKSNYKMFSIKEKKIFLIIFLIFSVFVIKFLMSDEILQNSILYERIVSSNSVEELENDGRSQIIFYAFKLFLSNPCFGIGLNQYPLYSQRMFRVGLMTHNDIVDIFVSMGILGGIVYVLMLVIIYKKIDQLNKFDIIKRNIIIYKSLFFIYILYGIFYPNYLFSFEIIILSFIIGNINKIRNIPNGQK